MTNRAIAATPATGSPIPFAAAKAGLRVFLKVAPGAARNAGLGHRPGRGRQGQRRRRQAARQGMAAAEIVLQDFRRLRRPA